MVHGLLPIHFSSGHAQRIGVQTHGRAEDYHLEVSVLRSASDKAASGAWFIIRSRISDAPVLLQTLLRTVRATDRVLFDRFADLSEVGRATALSAAEEVRISTKSHTRGPINFGTRHGTRAECLAATADSARTNRALLPVPGARFRASAECPTRMGHAQFRIRHSQPGRFPADGSSCSP